jgi:threonine/homoserine/homoserine lactone efflux protein
MLHPLFEGLILGLTIAITLGPALFALMQTSIKYGVRMGIFLALGIFSSDLTIVLGAYFGASQIVTDKTYHLILGVIGGVFMLIFGTYTIFKKMPKTEQVEAINLIQVKKQNVFRYFIKGFILNLANPFLWVFWITSVLAINGTYGGDKKAVVMFFTGTLSMVLMTDVLKVLLANKIKMAGNPMVKVWVNRIVGILFVIFGLFIIAGSLLEYYRGISLQVPAHSHF